MIITQIKNSLRRVQEYFAKPRSEFARTAIDSSGRKYTLFSDLEVLGNLAQSTGFNWDDCNRRLKSEYPRLPGRFPALFKEFPELVNYAKSHLGGYHMMRIKHIPDTQIQTRRNRIIISLVEKARQLYLFNYRAQPGSIE